MSMQLDQKEGAYQTEDQFRSLFSAAGTGIAVSTPTGRFLQANAAYCRMLGYTQEELQARDFASITHPEDLATNLKQRNEVLTGQRESFVIEKRYLRKNGAILWARASVSAGHTADGKISTLIVVAEDITEQKRIEMRFRRLVDSNVQGVFFWNTKGEITGGNDAFLNLVGYSRRDLECGRINWVAITPAEYAHLDRRALSEMAATGICEAFEKEFLRKDGSRVPIMLGAAAFGDNPHEGVCFALDLSERKHAEDALRESERHFRFLNDLLEQTRTLVDPEQILAVTARMLGEHLRASRCAYADVTQDGEEFAVLHDYTNGCASTVGSYQLSSFGTRAKNALSDGQTHIIHDVDTELPPGEQAGIFKAIGIKAIIACPLIKDGGLRAMMAVQQTSRRDWKPDEIAVVQVVVQRCWAAVERSVTEEQIRQLNLELEQRVKVRTAELEAANAELEAFSYSVSHDLRSPLRAVDGFAQAALEDYGAQLPEEGQRFLRTIRAGTQKMGALIDDLLTFSRLGRAPLRKQEVNVGRLIRDVLDDLRDEQVGRQVHVSFGELSACDGDPALLKQVWINLLSNALKFTKRRELAEIELGCEQKPEGAVYFVRDNGTGFDMRYANKLFGVFQRLHRAEDYEGTGVGLAIVQRIIQRHGGRIWVESAVDRGTTFYFTLR